MNYDYAVENAIDGWAESKLELFLFYCMDVFTRDAAVVRSAPKVNGEKRGDKYLVVPRVRRVDEFLSKGSVDDFFRLEEKRRDGLSDSGFEEYLVRHNEAYRKYVESEKYGRLLDLG